MLILYFSRGLKRLFVMLYILYVSLSDLWKWHMNQNMERSPDLVSIPTICLQLTHFKLVWDNGAITEGGFRVIKIFVYGKIFQTIVKVRRSVKLENMFVRFILDLLNISETINNERYIWSKSNVIYLFFSVYIWRDL